MADVSIPDAPPSPGPPVAPATPPAARPKEAPPPLRARLHLPGITDSQRQHLYKTIAPFAGDAPTPDANRRALALFLNRIFVAAPQLKIALDPKPLEGTDEREVWDAASRELYLVLSFRTGDAAAELVHMYQDQPVRTILNSLEALYEPDVNDAPLQRLVTLNVGDYASAAALRVALNDLFLRVTEVNPDGKASLLRAALTAKRGAPALTCAPASSAECAVSA